MCYLHRLSLESLKNGFVYERVKFVYRPPCRGGLGAEARSAEGASTGAPIVNHHAEEHTSPHWAQRRALTYFWRRARAGRAST